MNVSLVRHGDYRLVLGENVLLCVMYQSFNDLTAVELKEEVKRILEKTPRDAVYVDNRLWGLMTPEAAEVLADLNRWTIHHGVHYNAHLNISFASRAIVDANLSPNTESYERRTFETPEEATQWLAECGYPISEAELAELYSE